MISWVIQYFLCIEVLPWTTYTVVGDIYVLPNGRRLQSTLFFKRLWISSSGLPQRREGSTGYFRPLSQHQSEEKCLGLTDTNLKVPEWPEEAAVTVLVTQSGLTLCHPGTAAHQAPLSVGFSRQVGCHALLQRISLTQGLNLCLLHCRQFLYWWVIDLLKISSPPGCPAWPGYT